MKQKDRSLLYLLTLTMLLFSFSSIFAAVSVTYVGGGPFPYNRDATISVIVHVTDNPIWVYDIITKFKSTSGGAFGLVTGLNNLTPVVQIDRTSQVDGLPLPAPEDFTRMYDMAGLVPIFNPAYIALDLLPTGVYTCDFTVHTACAIGTFTVDDGDWFDPSTGTSATTAFYNAGGLLEPLTVNSATYTVVDAPPIITSTCPPSQPLDACGVFTYQFTATDADEGFYCLPAADLAWSVVVVPPTPTATISPTGLFTFDPATGAAALGPKAITVKVTDEFGVFAQCQFTITVNNDPPQITNCPSPTPFDWDACLDYTHAFAATDQNICLPATLTWSIVPLVANAAIDPGTGAFTYTHAFGPAALGPKAIVVRATDQFGAYADCPFTINVVNAAPTITNCPTPSPFDFDACLVYTRTFTATDPNACGTNLTWSLINPPPSTEATTTLVPGPAMTADFSFDPKTDPTALGPKVITVRVTDQFGAYTDCIFTINVFNTTPAFTNCPPPDLVVSGCRTFNYQFTVLDPNKCVALVYSLVNPPANATIDGATGAFVYDPADDMPSGPVPITVKVIDEYGAFALCQFSINVKADAPVFTVCPNADADIPVLWGGLLQGFVHAMDPDSIPPSNGRPLPLEYTLLSFDGPVLNSLSVPTPFEVNLTTGVWSWQTEYGNNAYSGEFNVSIKVYDGCKADTCNFTVHCVGIYAIIDKLHDVLQGHYAFVPVEIHADGDLLGGFDLLIGYDASALTLSEVLPGPEISAPTLWEYFTYRFGATGNCNGACPSGLVRIVAMADINNGFNHPPADAYHVDGTVATLKFLVTNDRGYGCQFVPLGFYWLDCTDNVLSSKNGQNAYISHYVWWYTGDFPPSDVIRIDTVTDGTVWGGYGGWGGILGHENCLVGQKITPKNWVDFYDGGIDIVCADSIDARGDLNLNGIANEIADAVLFTQYFLIGPDAFPILPGFPKSREAAIAASDVNADGKPLTIGDLVYLLRIIVGDALPYAKLDPYNSNVDISVFGDKISTESSETIGALYLTFDVTGDNFTVVNHTNMEVLSNRVGNKLNVLVYSGTTNLSNAIPAGTRELLTVTGAQLNSVAASDYYGSLLNTRVAKSALPTQFSLSQNIPNPFNPSTKIGLNLPSFTGWQIDIYNVNGQLVQSYNGTNIGHVEVTWDASNAASGIYFYKVTAGSFTDTKKMVLMK